jgi:CRP-like cAMP-binding protein
MTVVMSPAVICDYLRRVRLFATVPEPELDAVARASRLLHRRKGARIFEEGSPADCCLVLTSGRAKVVMSGERDTEIIVGMLEPLCVVGELALIDRSTRSAAIVATEDCEFIRIPPDAFERLRAIPAFEQGLLTQVLATLRKANDQLRAMYTFGSTERVAWALGRLARERGRAQGTRVVIEPRPTHQALADLIGSSRETVTRALLVLKRKKCLTWTPGTLEIETTAFKRHFRSDLIHRDVTDITRLV